MDLLPASGSLAGNGSLLAKWTQAAMAAGPAVTAEDLVDLREDQLPRGLVVMGQGRGGSAWRSAPEPPPPR